jgi:hypothetical protein
MHQLRAQRRLNVRHQQGSRNSLARNITDSQCGAFGAKRREVEIVATHSSRRLARTPEFQGFQPRELLREQLGLHVPRNFQFVFKSLFLLRLANQALDVRGHSIERPRKFAQLVFGSDRDAMRKVAFLHFAGALVKIRNDACDRPGKFGSKGQ